MAANKHKRATSFNGKVDIGDDILRMAPNGQTTGAIANALELSCVDTNTNGNTHLAVKIEGTSNLATGNLATTGATLPITIYTTDSATGTVTSGTYYIALNTAAAS